MLSVIMLSVVILSVVAPSIQPTNCSVLHILHPWTNFSRQDETCGLYYKFFIIIIYDRNDSGQYYKTTITIIIDDPS